MWGNPWQQSKRIDCFLFLYWMLWKQRSFTMYFWKAIMSGKITVIDRQQNEKRSRHYGSLWTQTTNPEFLVAKDEILAALATVSVTLSSLLTTYLTKFYRLTIMWCWWNVRTSCPIIMWNWPDIFKIWSDNVRWPTVISSPAILIVSSLDATQICIIKLSSNR